MFAMIGIFGALVTIFSGLMGLFCLLCMIMIVINVMKIDKSQGLPALFQKLYAPLGSRIIERCPQLVVKGADGSDLDISPVGGLVGAWIFSLIVGAAFSIISASFLAVHF